MYDMLTATTELRLFHSQWLKKTLLSWRGEAGLWSGPISKSTYLDGQLGREVVIMQKFCRGMSGVFCFCVADFSYLMHILLEPIFTGGCEVKASTLATYRYPRFWGREALLQRPLKQEDTPALSSSWIAWEKATHRRFRIGFLGAWKKFSSSAFLPLFLSSLIHLHERSLQAFGVRRSSKRTLPHQGAIVGSRVRRRYSINAQLQLLELSDIIREKKLSAVL